MQSLRHLAEFLFGDWRLTELTQPAVHILENIPRSGAQTHK